MEIELSNGAILDLPDGTAPEAARNYAIRAEAKLKSAADNQAAREQSQAPAAPAEPTNMFGGTPLLDRFGLKGVREAAGSVLNHETGIPPWIGRGMLGRASPLGLGDLGAGAINIASRGTPLDSVAPGGEVFGAPDLGVLAARTPEGAPPVQVPYPSQVVGDAIGLPRANPNAPMGEKIAEAILSFGRGTGLPFGPGRVPLATSPATGVRAASPMTQRAANAAGTVAGGTASVVGSDLGTAMAEKLGLDPELGAILGGLAGGVTPSAASNTLGKLATQHALGDRGPGGQGTFWNPNQGSAAAVQLADETGITPSPGLVGNQSAARLENTAAGIPIVGQIAKNRQNQQLRQFQEQHYADTERMGGPVGQEPLSVDLVGDQMKLAAQRGERNLRGDFDERYRQIDEGVPPETLVRPVETYTEANRIQQPGSGESPGSRAAVTRSLEQNLEPAVQTARSVRDTPNGPVSVDELGIPYPDVRPIGSDLFRAEQGANPPSAGAQLQVRQALTEDTANTLMNHPLMVQAFPDPAARQAKVEQLRVTSREYAQENARDTVGTGPPMLAPGTGEALGGGGFPILDKIQNAPDEAAAYRQASKPGAMEVLQRTNPDDYSPLAANVINQQSQSRTPFGDINISPVVFSRWWDSLGPNERMILANDNPDLVARMGDRAGMGDRFRQRSFTENYSNTSPMMSTVGALVAASADPLMVMNKAFGAAAAAAGISSDTLARFIARTNPEAFRMAMQRGLDAARATGGIVADPRGSGAP
jgi:hypothetical protein